jgi:hypothetical protein
MKIHVDPGLDLLLLAYIFMRAARVVEPHAKVRV